jgi:hypothetical protein
VGIINIAMGWVDRLKRFGLVGTVDLNCELIFRRLLLIVSRKLIPTHVFFLAERVGPLGAAQLAELLAYNTSVEGLDLRGINAIQIFSSNSAELRLYMNNDGDFWL